MPRARNARSTARSPRKRTRDGLEQLPYAPFQHGFAALQVIRNDQVEAIHRASMTILETTGLRVLEPEARRLFKEAGFRVDEASQQVRFDRAGIADLVAKAPAKTSVRGRGEGRRLEIGGDTMVIATVGGPPFVSDLERGRRPGTSADMEDFLKLTQSLNIIHIEGGCSVEPTDLPPETRHLDFYLAASRLTDKSWKPLSNGFSKARDAIEMGKILYGVDEEALAGDPVFFVNTNTNTPLVLDAEITQGIIAFAEVGQPICVTPFALSGAMAPTTLAGALALQNAETLAACALVQLVRPGCPYIYGSFTSNVDMRTGSPAFGTPEYALAAQASGQLARRYGLPWRSSNTTASNAADAQAAYESEMSIWGAVTGRASILNQGAGWLEGGLVASYEKLILDAEMLQMMQVWSQGFPVDEDSLGIDAIAEVGPGGHFFGSEHTLQRFETAFYAPLVSDWSNYENWTDAGARDAAGRATLIWQKLLADFQPPPLDPGVDEALAAYVRLRKEAHHLSNAS
ncbi:MAG: trimethylamine methyltransferase family protein [Pseudomonadota bacterium]